VQVKRQRAKVKRQSRRTVFNDRGSDVIKFCATGGVLSKGDNPEFEQYSPEEMRTLITAARRLGRKVAAHAHGATGIKDAVLAGVDSIEHGTFINEEDIRALRFFRT
jgi:imidazolonepropionase-like amidohydrolase